jgi:hypothetical protein
MSRAASLGLASLIAIVLLACSKPQVELTVSKDQVELREGEVVRVCTRTVAQPFEVGGGFECASQITIATAASGRPDVSEADLWRALTEAGVDLGEVGEAYLYMPQAGGDPRAAQGGMILAGEPDPNSLIGNYVVELSDRSLRIYVGLQRS